jgi:hypothetical protein
MCVGKPTDHATATIPDQPHTAEVQLVFEVPTIRIPVNGSNTRVAIQRTGWRIIEFDK